MRLLSNEAVELIKEVNLLEDNSKRLEFIKGTDIGNELLKGFIHDYYSDFMYQDRELLAKIEEYRGGKNLRGSLTPDINELRYYLQAFKSPQYHRFFLHIMNAYGNREVYPIIDDHVFDCCICWKRTFGSEMHDRWFALEEKDPNKEYLAFTVEGTKTTICLNCLIQLKLFISIINEINEVSNK